MTKTEARKYLRYISRLVGSTHQAINTNDAARLRIVLGDLAGWASQLQTDIFDGELGTGLRGVVDESDLS